MDVKTKKKNLKEIINNCKGYRTINEFLRDSSIESMSFLHVLDDKNEFFELTKITIQKILVNADRNLNKDIIKYELTSLIDDKNKGLEIQRGQIYWVDFGSNTIGTEQGGVRPALIIQNDRGNTNSPAVVAIAITSKLKSMHLPVHVVIDDLESCGLTENSMVLTEQVKTIDKSRVVGYIGECPHFLMKKIEKAIKIEFDILNPVNIIEFVEEFSTKFNLKDSFKAVLAREMQEFFKINNIDYVDIGDYVTECKRSTVFKNATNTSKTSQQNPMAYAM